MKTQAVWHPGKDKSFANGLNFYKLFWIFFIGCIVGVIVETIWCLVTLHKLESRQGLIYGPFNPVYGFGALLMTLLLYKLQGKRDLWIFLGSMVIGGAFEYLCSFVQEKVFGTVSWQYTQKQFDIQGRTSLLYAFFWGILGLLWLKELFPRLSHLIEKIPNKVGKPLTWVLVVFMALNMAVSALAVDRQTQRRQGVPATNIVSQLLDRFYPDSLMQIIYPNMIPVEDSQTPPAQE